MEAYNLTVKPWCSCLLLGLFAVITFLSSYANAETYYHEFVVRLFFFFHFMNLLLLLSLMECSWL